MIGFKIDIDDVERIDYLSDEEYNSGITQGNVFATFQEAKFKLIENWQEIYDCGREELYDVKLVLEKVNNLVEYTEV